MRPRVFDCWCLLAALLAGPYISALAQPDLKQGPTQVTDIEATQDNTIYSESGDLANGAGHFLFAGTTNYGNHRRALIRFSNRPSFPPGTVILEVELHIHVTRSRPGSLSESFSLHKLTADWGEGPSNAPGLEGRGTFAEPGDATWQDRFFNESTWANPGGDFDKEPSSELAIASDDAKPYVFSSTPKMVADFTSWLENPQLNFGWLLKGTETTFGTAKQIGAIDPRNVRPASITVTWFVMDGIFENGFEPQSE